jgi:hypothetical protein
MIEVEGQINAVRRRVGTRVLEAGEAPTITVSQTYDAPIEDVWDACTNADRIPRWFPPGLGDLRLGGRYSSRATRRGPCSAAIRRPGSRRPGSTAARSAGSSCDCRARPAAARVLSSSASPMSTTRDAQGAALVHELAAQRVGEPRAWRVGGAVARLQRDPAVHQRRAHDDDHAAVARAHRLQRSERAVDLAEIRRTIQILPIRAAPAAPASPCTFPRESDSRQRPPRPRGRALSRRFGHPNTQNLL